ncbi:uncharacterized protein LOC142350362 [Convolutriloba macropyga]|uniref:uncharacterized protein LOC142350362 n=1 Tax=Convolutriloba macropyga TaxID=536237 RepID=UPI003F52006B
MFDGSDLLNSCKHLMLPEFRTELSEDFVRYLMCDTFIMLRDTDGDGDGDEGSIGDHISDVADDLSAHNIEDSLSPANNAEINSEAVSDESSEDDEENDEVGFDHSPSFPELQAWIKETIDKLGGSVVTKIDNISPIDARWALGNNSCCCTSVDDVIILLKTSDRIRSHLERVASSACSQSHEFGQTSADSAVEESENSQDAERAETEECEHQAVMTSSSVNETGDDEADQLPVLRLIKFDLQINQLYEFRVFISQSRLLGACCKFGLFNDDVANRPQYYDKLILKYSTKKLMPLLNFTAETEVPAKNSEENGGDVNSAFEQTSGDVKEAVFVADMALKNQEKFVLVDFTEFKRSQTNVNLIFFHPEEFEVNDSEYGSLNVNLEPPLKQFGKLRYLSENCDQRTNLYPMNNVPLDLIQS